MNPTRMIMLSGLLVVSGLVASPAHAGMVEADRWIRLPESLYFNCGSSVTCTVSRVFRDRDADGLKDDLENRLADVWRPYFVFDEHENNGANTSELSLQSWEPRVLFRVTPVAALPYAPFVIRIKWAFLFRMDGGFRSDWLCTNHHSGDAQSGEYELISGDGINWRIDRINAAAEGWWWSNAPSLEVSARYANVAGAGNDRPLPKIYMAAGKHHQFYTGGDCENWSSFCNNDCGGGVERIASTSPWGYPTNVGEPAIHPTSASGDNGAATVNRPFVNWLWHLGYPNEQTWLAQWSRSDCTSNSPNGDIFTGGMNSGPLNTGAWISSSQGDTCVSPVYSLLR